MIWSATIRKAMIVTGLLLLTSVLWRIVEQVTAGTSLLVLAPLAAGIGTLGAVLEIRARRRAALVRRMRGPARDAAS